MCMHLPAYGSGEQWVRVKFCLSGVLCYCSASWTVSYSACQAHDHCLNIALSRHTSTILTSSQAVCTAQWLQVISVCYQSFYNTFVRCVQMENWHPILPFDFDSVKDIWQVFTCFVWLNGLVVSALGIRARSPGFESPVAPQFHWVATLGKLFTHIACPASQLQETGVQKGVFGVLERTIILNFAFAFLPIKDYMIFLRETNSFTNISLDLEKSFYISSTYGSAG